MPKPKTRYVCQTCGSAQPKWMGQCPDCGEWNTLVEMVVQPEAPGRPSSAALAAGGVGPQPLPDIPADGYERIPVPIDELSRVLGGGIVPGSVVLISGDPGIGKSTLLLQLCDALTRGRRPDSLRLGRGVRRADQAARRAHGDRDAGYPGAGRDTPGEHRDPHRAVRGPSWSWSIRCRASTPTPLLPARAA